MGTLLLALVPDRGLVLLIMATGFGLTLGVISRRTVFGFIGSILLFVLLSPFIDSLLEALPLWVLMIGMGFFCLSILHVVFGLLFGKGATDNFMGHLLWALFTMPFRIVGYLAGIRRWW